MDQKKAIAVVGIGGVGGYLVHEAEKLGIDVPVSRRMFARLQELSVNESAE